MKIAFTLFLAGLASLATAEEPRALTFTDFADTSGAPPGGGWSEEADGTIHLKGAGGNLISKEEYDNFELEWEWKLAPGANNGVKYWVTKIGKGEWLGIEYQMIDDERHLDAMRGDTHSTAAIYDIKGAAKDKAAKPAGEWNTSKIVVKDGKLQHWLNGKLAVEADTTTEDWKARIAASKFKSKEGFAPGKGRIMLTDHHDETWFKNIRIKRL